MDGSIATWRAQKSMDVSKRRRVSKIRQLVNVRHAKRALRASLKVPNRNHPILSATASTLGAVSNSTARRWTCSGRLSYRAVVTGLECPAST